MYFICSHVVLIACFYVQMFFFHIILHPWKSIFMSHTRELELIFLCTHTYRYPIVSGSRSLTDKCQPSFSWTDIDGYLGLFLQSLVHLSTEMESISACLLVRQTTGRGNLAGWHLLVFLCVSFRAISCPISQVYLKQTSVQHTRSPQLSAQRRTNWCSSEMRKSPDTLCCCGVWSGFFKQPTG